MPLIMSIGAFLPVSRQRLSRPQGEAGQGSRFAVVEGNTVDPGGVPAATAHDSAIEGHGGAALGAGPAAFDTLPVEFGPLLGSEKEPPEGVGLGKRRGCGDCCEEEGAKQAEHRRSSLAGRAICAVIHSRSQTASARLALPCDGRESVQLRTTINAEAPARRASR